MAQDSLAYRTAQSHVHMYGDAFQGIMAQHAEAMECRDCEAFLQMGIDAFEWLMRADREYRMAIYRGEIEHDPDFDKALQNDYEGWLNPCQYAEKWIESQLTRGFKIDNLVEFRRCVEEMNAIVEAYREGDNPIFLPEGIAEIRDAAIIEHQNGQSAGFI
jgi:hypothetical protein